MYRRSRLQPAGTLGSFDGYTAWMDHYVQGPSVICLDVRAGPTPQEGTRKPDTQAMHSLALLSATVAGEALHQYD